jgi:predicted RNA-binding protein with EMAP domain
VDEFQTIAVGGLVNKAMLERINEKNEKIFDALMAHDRWTNTQLAEMRDQQTQLDGKIVAVQTEMRQSFEQQGKQIADQGKQIASLRGEVATQGQKLDQVLHLLTALVPKPEQENS